jgi:hypothetical protein
MLLAIDSEGHVGNRGQPISLEADIERRKIVRFERRGNQPSKDTAGDFAEYVLRHNATPFKKQK